MGERNPHFFKVLLGDFKESLRIPPAFIKHIQDEESNVAILYDKEGNTWNVQLEKTIKGTFLSNGWSGFIDDCGLEEEDFLVFKYEGDMNFLVLIFDKTACEKESVIMIESEDGLGNCRERGARRSLNFNSVFSKREIKSELDEVFTGQGKYKSSLQEMLGKIKMEDLGMEFGVGSNNRYEPGSSSQNQAAKSKKLKAEEMAGNFHSELPYFVSRMTKAVIFRSKSCRVPAGFAKKHLPANRSDIVLRDPTDKTWVVVYIPADKYKHIFSAGWSSFARGNKIKPGNFCAFELVGPAELRVTIFRGS